MFDWNFKKSSGIINLYETKFDIILVSYHVFFSSKQKITRIVLRNFIHNPGYNFLDPCKFLIQVRLVTSKTELDI